MIASDGRGLLIDWENAGGERDKTSWSVCTSVLHAAMLLTLRI